MKIAIAGGTGFIGQKLGLTLALRGHEIVLLSRNADVPQMGFPLKVAVWNPSKKSLDAGALAGVEAVINLAGTGVAEKRWTEDIKKSILNSRLDSVETLWSAIGKTPSVKSFISASAIGYYGDRKDEELSENAQTGQGFLSEVCQKWESAVLSHPSSHVRKVCVRVGIVLGRNGGALKQMLPIFKKNAGGVLGSGSQWMSWIHIDDIVNIFVQAVENPKYSGVINGVSANPVTNSDFTKTLGQTLSRLTVIPTPALALKAVFGEMSEVLLGSQKVKPQKLQELGFKWKFEKLSEALEDLCGYMKDGTEMLEAHQYVDRPLEEVFKFFSDEKNLEELTPKMLNFNVLSKSTPQIQKGTLIYYKLKIHGVPAKWTTEIEDWQPNKKFVDNQIKGPYSRWHHTHEFKPLGSGTYMYDRVYYKLPMGLLGKAVAGAFVANDVKKIFAYRCEKMKELFP